MAIGEKSGLLITKNEGHEEHDTTQVLHADSQDDSAQAVPQERNVEIDDQPKTQTCNSKITDCLRDVNWMDVINRFDFQNEPPFNDKVDPLITENPPAIANRHALFTFKLQISG